MALDKDGLANAMINAAKSAPDGGAAAMMALGKAVEDYLTANTEAKYGWTAQLPSAPFTPDSTSEFTAELMPSGKAFASNPDDFSAFISDLADFLNGIQIQAPSGFTLPPLASGSGSFTAEQSGEMDDPKDCDACMQKSFGLIAQGIIDGWESYFAPASSGAHSSYVGAASLSEVK